ncbi:MULTISPECIES: MerR family transcriptional regulator [Bacillus cereus group]|jgi:DNA-binding transcriptional MerR regulator|uniref:MerR family transcriptional regulator n=1 Tax=Bacillus cereus TaxID=1396 RepID=A0A2B8T6B0_BACCE|nr:MerR family transcriptional regulator [Bacillus cereus]PDY81563.1 MerR family transcriptional regulator [Bacillus cereus]PFA03424.1 MerR family transcriptional regulator [Bacillus cereus]PFM34009.1 MerR family transcriptional regulator [Bacillus cereus]PGL60863.1 MerR family transcriptional regulator [Bacillus cereus]PGQ09377.1 MerR family transcriptional regulator [Bacillus cereus]
MEKYEKKLSIQSISSITGLSSYTLRYYEKIGLLCTVNRDENGYRCYTETDISCIDFLVKLRKTKMSIDDMKKFVELRRQGESTISERRELLEAHQKKVLQQIKELEIDFTKINEKVDYYKKMEGEK